MRTPLLIATVLLLCLSAVSPALVQAGDNGAPALKKVHVGEIDIAWKELGAGDPLVMIMGYGGSMDLWSPRLLQLLSASYHLFLFDNRGMGGSTSSETEYSIPLFAQDTLGFMDALGIDRATILGWSMGAETALELAISHPQRVSKLILISGAPGGREQIAPSPDVMRQLADSSGGSLMRGLRVIRLLFPQDWLSTHPFWTYFPIHASMNPLEHTSRQLRAIMDWAGSCSRLDQIESPTLIITGDADVVFPTQNSTLLADGIHGSRLVRIPDGGHGVMFQYPDRIADEIAVFLRDTGDGER
ncbi:MAG: alpha/beta hydrolase [Spirochaetia bacterium]|jgi:pimeloyl-ACP methyl ester carboxylesterase